MKITKTEINRDRHRWWHNFGWVHRRFGLGVEDDMIIYYCSKCGWEFRTHYEWEL